MSKYKRTATAFKALQREVILFIEAGEKPEYIALKIGIARAHIYRVMKVAGVEKYHLSPDERQIIEARRKLFRS